MNEVKQSVKQKTAGLFEQIPISILQEPKLTPAEFRVLLYLLSYNKKVFPSYTEIMSGTGLNQNTISRALHGETEKEYQARFAKAEQLPLMREYGLVELNVLDIRKGSSNNYTIKDVSKWSLESRRARALRGETIKTNDRKRKKDRFQAAVRKEAEKMRREIEVELREKASDAANAKHDTKQQAKIDDEWKNRELSRDDETA